MGGHQSHRRPVATRVPRSVIGAIKKERGMTAERRVAQAFSDHSANAPAWLRELRKATTKEDQRGIDFVAETDIGKLFLQIKSSETGKKEFLQRRRKSAITVVIVRTTMSNEEIWREVINHLETLYQEFLTYRSLDISS